MSKLLTREEFKRTVFARDKNTCLCCQNAAVDCHHIIDRSLFVDGGYFKDNAASVCSSCHFKAEQTLISCSTLRILAKIKTIVLPKNFDPTLEYDKWGNIIEPDGSRKPGPLFYQENVQKILKPILYLFNKHIKY